MARLGNWLPFKCYGYLKLEVFFPVSIYLLKVNNKITRTTCEKGSKLTKRTTKRHHWQHSYFLVTNAKFFNNNFFYRTPVPAHHSLVSFKIAQTVQILFSVTPTRLLHVVLCNNCYCAYAGVFFHSRLSECC